MPEILKAQVIHMVQEHITELFKDESDELMQPRNKWIFWKWVQIEKFKYKLYNHKIVEAVAQNVEHTP